MSIRIASTIRDVMQLHIRPMIKEECLEQFDRGNKDLDELIEDIRRTKNGTFV